MVRLRATSSKRASAVPKSAASRAPSLRQSTAHPYLHRRCSNTVFSQSLWGPWVLVHASLFELFALGHGVSPHSCSSAPHLTGVSLILDVGYVLTAAPAPTILLGFLWSWTWGISSHLLTPAKHSCCSCFGFSQSVHWPSSFPTIHRLHFP